MLVLRGKREFDAYGSPGVGYAFFFKFLFDTRHPDHVYLLVFGKFHYG